jgi:membrane protease YdiL (CAAX protease family)
VEEADQIFPGWKDLGLSLIVLVLSIAFAICLLLGLIRLGVDSGGFTFGIVGYLLLLSPFPLVSWYFSCKKYNIPFQKGLDFLPVSTFAVLEGVLFAIVCVALYFLISRFTGESVIGRSDLAEMSNHYGRQSVLNFAGAFIGPFFEEIFYRSFLMRIFQEKLGINWAFWIVTIVFVCAHPNFFNDWPQLLILFVGSALLTFLRIKWKSIWPSIAMHMAVNTAALIQFYSYYHASLSIPVGGK